MILAPAIARERQEKAGKGWQEPRPALHSPTGTRDSGGSEKYKAKKNVSW